MADRVMRAVALIEAHDKTGKAFASAAAKVENLGKQMKLVENASLGLNKAMIRGGDVTGLTKAREKLVAIRTEMQAAQAKAKELSAAMKAGDAGAASAYAKAQAEIKRLAASYDRAKTSAAQAAREFKAAKAAAALTGSPLTVPVVPHAKATPGAVAPLFTPMGTHKAKPGAVAPLFTPMGTHKAKPKSSSITLPPIIPLGGASSIFPMLGAYGAYQVAERSAKRSAAVDRSMTRTGITGDAGAADTAAGMAALRSLARETATSFDQVREGLDSIVASGRSFSDGLRMIPSVVKTAQASGSEVADIANSSTALLDHMGVKIGELQAAQDILAKGGKLGKFELKDAARYLPSMLPAAKATGLKGLSGLSRLSAVLQVIRGGTGTAEEAATSAANIFAKMESEETTKRFKKFGVDLRTEMEKARKEGKDLIGVFVELTQMATKGDMSKIPQLFSDMELARGMRALVGGWEKVARLQKEIASSTGTVQADLNRVLQDNQARLDRLKEAGDRAAKSLGDALIQVSATPMDKLIQDLDAIADKLDKFNKTSSEKGIGAAVGEAAKEAVVGFLGGDYVFRTAPGGASQTQVENDALRRESDLRKAIHERQTQGYLGGPTEAQLQVKLDHQSEVGRRIRQGRAGLSRAYSSTMGTLNWMGNREPLTAGPGQGAYGSIAPGGSPGTGVGAFPLSANIFPNARKGWGKPAPASPASGGAVEAVVKPDQITAKAEVTGEATVKVPVTITVNDGAVKNLIRAEVADQMGKVRLHTNGPGSTGTSSPDAK